MFKILKLGHSSREGTEQCCYGTVSQFGMVHWHDATDAFSRHYCTETGERLPETLAEALGQVEHPNTKETP